MFHNFVLNLTNYEFFLFYFRNISRVYFSSSSSAVDDYLAQHDLGFKSSYSPEQTYTILDAVNKLSQLELKNYDISNLRIKKLMDRREKRGNFSAVEDLLELDGFGVKVLMKFCNSVLKSKVEEVEKVQGVEADESESDSLPAGQSFEILKKSQFVTPVMLDIVRDSINTVVSLHVDLNYFAWTKFYYNRNANEKLEVPKINILAWNCYDIRNQDKKLRLSDLIQFLVELNDQIPEADAYVIESLPIAVQARQPGSALQVNLNIQKTQMIAMLSVLMASRCSMNKILIKNDAEESNSKIPKDEQTYFDSVYFLRNFLPSRFYKILVGNERVSSASVINRIINYNHVEINPAFDPTFSSIDIPEELRHYWKESDRVHQEYLGNAMLTGLTFVKLCVDRCRKSVATLNRKSLKPKS